MENQHNTEPEIKALTAELISHYFNQAIDALEAPEDIDLACSISGTHPDSQLTRLVLLFIEGVKAGIDIAERVGEPAEQ